jgi:hypothetical protein
MKTLLLFFPLLSFAPPNKLEIKPTFDYSEHIRQKLNCILEIEDGSNYWDAKNKIESKEMLIIKYLENGKKNRR